MEGEIVRGREGGRERMTEGGSLLSYMHPSLCFTLQLLLDRSET